MTKRRKKSAINPIVKFFVDIVKNPKQAKYEGIFKAALIVGLALVVIIVLWFTGLLGKLTFFGACFKSSC
jgi:hypothetical protein